MEKDFLQCPFRVNDPLENELTYSEFKRYVTRGDIKRVQGGLIIALPGEYKKPWGGCKKIRDIVSSRYFNRYRGLYTMQTLDDMVQEAFIGMLLHKDYFTKEPPADEKTAESIISQAIRKHFKKLYREATAAGRDLDNGRHNARIEPKQKPLKVLIDEIDFDPEKEPESVMQANDVRNWRIGGTSKALVDEIDFDPEKEPESKGYKDIIYFYDHDNNESEISPAPSQLLHEKTMSYKPKKRIQGKITEKDYPCSALWPEDIRPGAPRKIINRLPVQHNYTIDPFTYSVNDWTYDDNFITSERAESYCLKTCQDYDQLCSGQKIAVYYKRTQTKTAANKLKIEKEISYNYKRKDEAAALELINLHHAALFPDHKPATDEQIAKQLNVYPSMLKYWRAQYPGFYPVYFPQGAPGPLKADPAYRQFIIEHFQEPLTRQQQPLTIRYYTSDAPDAPVYRQFTFEHFREPLPWEAWRFQWAKDGFSYFSNMDRRALLIQILREALAVINTMPEQQACITKLYYYQGMTQTEICALLHRSARKVQLAREVGLESIKQHFDYHYPLTDIVKILEGVRKQILNREILPL
jgi:DNA-directed RNA polymerase specialized sigma24 family protein